jgi:pimeloyl-ACP methyl ester carboxylesterase
MAEERVTFQSHGLALAGIVRLPETLAAAERRPAFIVLHGFGSRMTAANVLQPCALLEKLGYVTLRFDMPGCGESEGEKGRVICLEQVAATRDALAFLARHRNVDGDRIALTGSSYTTGQSVTWVQKRDGCAVGTWERPQRKSVDCLLGVDHVMASSALPFLFPAVNVDGAWFGDGGIRLTAPLSPAVHLGARRILAVSTRYARSRDEADRPAIAGYPPPAQVAGVLYNAIFLDQLDSDALEMHRINRLIGKLPESERLSLPQLVRDLIDRGRCAREAESIDDIISKIVAEHRPGDIVVLMSNGGFGGIHQKLLRALSAWGPREAPEGSEA